MAEPTPVKQATEHDTSISANNAFTALGLSAKVVRPLAVLGIAQPTPIQIQAIPLVLAGHDVMGLAQTGTGKTAAFGLPLIDRLMSDGERPQAKSARSLILAPTRELVNQIADNLRAYVKKTPIWVSSVVGGQSINPQIKHLVRGTDVLVATPGRLLDLVNRKAISLETARYLVLDEADQMLDLGFIHDLKKIARMLGTPRQTLLFSATMPAAVAELSKAYLNDPVRVQVAPPGKAADNVVQSVQFVHAKAKTELLKRMLAEREQDLSLVFARTKHGAEKLMKSLVAGGFAAASIHGNKSQGQRDRALKAFKTGEVRILVATDVAARGIDIPKVSHVYNFNLPEVPENYVHRIGRTARAGRDGAAVAFCSPDERKLLKQIERLMGIDIPVSGTDGSDLVAAPPAAPKRGRGGSTGNVNADGTPKKKRNPRNAEQAAKGRATQPHKKHPRQNKPSQERDLEGSSASAAEGDFRSAPQPAVSPEGKKRRPKHSVGARPGKRQGENPRTGKFAGDKNQGEKKQGAAVKSSRPSQNRAGPNKGKGGGRNRRG